MSNWFSSYLQQEVKVLFFNPETCIRRVEDVSGKNYTRQIRVNESNAVTMFSDGYPFLICNESSVEELKKKLPEGACTISVNNFRPNIVVSDTSGPYIEDEWRCLNINGVKLYCEKPCGRCTLTTVDPKTGVKNAKAEPLNTLFKTRVLPEYSTKSPMFCWNMVLDSTPGDINVGDGVYQ